MPDFWFGLILWGTTVLVAVAPTALVMYGSLAGRPPRASEPAPRRTQGRRSARQLAQGLRRLIGEAIYDVLSFAGWVIIVGLSALIGWYCGQLIVAVVLTVGLVIGGYFSSPSLVGGYLLGALGIAFALVAWLRAANITLAMADTRAATPGDGPLLDLVASLAVAAGIPVPAARVLNESALEIFSVCSTRRSGAILLSSGLVELLARDELEGVIAHETVRIKNGDARFTATLMALFGTASILSRRLLRWCSQQPGNHVLLVLPVSWFGLMARLVGDGFGLTVKAAFGRTREQLADAEAIELTRDPTALVAALKKMQSGPSRRQERRLCRVAAGFSVPTEREAEGS